VKYQPYKGYHHKPWLSYWAPYYPRRIKTRHDWHWRHLPAQHTLAHETRNPGRRGSGFCGRCGKTHCWECGCWQPWKKYDKDSNAANYEKRVVHRAFRRQARAAIRRELWGDDAVSHAFYISGDWLD
jgi:hypothetical protein